MSNFLTSSVGKKVIMSVTGLFLVVFLLVHLTLNLLVFCDEDGSIFNAAAHFMGTNPVMSVMQWVLGAGFIFHIIYATILTLQNQSARPINYAVSTKSDITWSSQNMFITGASIGIFLVIHLINYFYKIKFTDLIEGGLMTEYDLVKGIFQPAYWYFTLLYVAAFILLGLHLNHSFQSSFQTLGLNNTNWMPRLKFLGTLYAAVVAIGFSAIPVYFFIKAIINN